MTLITYILLARLFHTPGLCCSESGLTWRKPNNANVIFSTPVYVMAVHIALSCTPGIPLGVLSSLKRRIGDFFTNSTTVLHLSPFQRTKPPLMRIGLMGALAGLLILSTPLHKFLTTTLVFTLVMVPAMISAIATQVRKRISRVARNRDNLL